MVCCNIRGDYVLVVKFSGGLCPSCKIQRGGGGGGGGGGGLCPSCKIYGGTGWYCKQINLQNWRFTFYSGWSSRIANNTGQDQTAH